MVEHWKKSIGLLIQRSLVWSLIGNISMWHCDWTSFVPHLWLKWGCGEIGWYWLDTQECQVGGLTLNSRQTNKLKFVFKLYQEFQFCKDIWKPEESVRSCRGLVTVNNKDSDLPFVFCCMNMVACVCEKVPWKDINFMWPGLISSFVFCEAGLQTFKLFLHHLYACLSVCASGQHFNAVGLKILFHKEIYFRFTSQVDGNTERKTSEACFNIFLLILSFWTSSFCLYLYHYWR